MLIFSTRILAHSIGSPDRYVKSVQMDLIGKFVSIEYNISNVALFLSKLYFPLGTGDDGTEPKRARPSDAHKLLALLEQHRMLLRVYSQNIDGLVRMN